MPKKRKGARIGRTVKGHEQKQGACCPEQAEKRDERTAAAALHGMRAETWGGATYLGRRGKCHVTMLGLSVVYVTNYIRKIFAARFARGP